MKLLNFIGIDISKKTLDIMMLNIEDNKKSLYRTFTNDYKGFLKLINWLKKQKIDLSSTLFCMEHTGIWV